MLNTLLLTLVSFVRGDNMGLMTFREAIDKLLVETNVLNTLMALFISFVRGVSLFSILSSPELWRRARSAQWQPVSSASSEVRYCRLWRRCSAFKTAASLAGRHLYMLKTLPRC